MDIRTKLILALVITSLISMTLFTAAAYYFSADVLVGETESLAAGEFLNRLIKVGLSIGSLAILSGVLIGAFLARQIRELAETVERIRHGELSLRAKIVGEDEVALLARSFNEFLDQLNRSSDIFQLGRLRVLVAENDLTNRHLLSELLTNWRMRATFANTAEEITEALRAAEEYDEPIQILLLDMNIPELQDVNFLQRTIKPNPQTRYPTILIAPDVEILPQTQLRSLGIQHVLPAPVVASDLMESILDEMGVSAAVLEDLPDVFLVQSDPHKILLVEDSPIIQKVTSSFLENWGHDVTIAEDGQIAVRLATEQQYDLILMDLEMPNMGGIEATLAIRNAEADLEHRAPIVALTAKATKADREQCMAAGMDEYISKPVDPKVLYRLVNAQAVHTPRTDAQAPAPLPEPGEAPASILETGPDEPLPQPEPVIDWEAARTFTGGNKALLDELVDMFPDASNQQLQTIEQALINIDAEEITREAHALKAAARIFGATELENCACEIETFGRLEEFGEIKSRIPILRERTNILIAELAATAQARS